MFDLLSSFSQVSALCRNGRSVASQPRPLICQPGTWCLIDIESAATARPERGHRRGQSGSGQFRASMRSVTARTEAGFPETHNGSGKSKKNPPWRRVFNNWPEMKKSKTPVSLTDALIKPRSAAGFCEKCHISRISGGRLFPSRGPAWPLCPGTRMPGRPDPLPPERCRVSSAGRRSRCLYRPPR